MATLNYTYTGARNIEGVNQARAVYNAAAAAEAAAKNPPAAQPECARSPGDASWWL